MSFDLDRFVRAGFQHLGPKNPLAKLSDDDRRLLMAVLWIYLHPVSEHQRREYESPAKTVAEVGRIASKLRAHVFRWPLPRVLQPALDAYRDLPERLETFSRRFGPLITEMMGKPGHKRKIARSQWLVVASEFVRLKTGKHNDDHLAELVQGVTPSQSLEARAGEDISGENISKQRRRMKRNYPLIYQDALNKLHALIEMAPEALKRRSSGQHVRKSIN